MRIFITCSIATLMAVQGSAQLSTFQCSYKVAAASTGKKAVTDAAGNIYVWVTAPPPVTIGFTNYTYTFGSTDNYLVKYDTNGTIIAIFKKTGINNYERPIEKRFVNNFTKRFQF